MRSDGVHSAFSGETIPQSNSAALALQRRRIPMRDVLIAAIITAFCAGSGLAQTGPATTPTTTNPASAEKVVPKTKTTNTTKTRSSESIGCSEQADAKGLHGKERKTFRATCKREMMKRLEDSSTGDNSGRPPAPAMRYSVAGRLPIPSHARVNSRTLRGVVNPSGKSLCSPVLASHEAALASLVLGTSHRDAARPSGAIRRP